MFDLFNPPIIARKLGLKEQTDITTNGASILKIEVLEQNTRKEKLTNNELKQSSK